jgi:hypothetical protein
LEATRVRGKIKYSTIDHGTRPRSRLGRLSVAHHAGDIGELLAHAVIDGVNSLMDFVHRQAGIDAAMIIHDEALLGLAGAHLVHIAQHIAGRG